MNKSEALAKGVIEDIYGSRIFLRSLTVDSPKGGWTASFLGRYEGERQFLQAIFDGDSLSYYDPETVAPEELRTDGATPTKRILKWNGFEIGLQYFPYEKRHNRILTAGYGHFRKTRGADGMAVDVYVGGNLGSEKVFAIDQLINGEFDEEKMVIGVDTMEAAISLYTAAMPREMLGGIREISLEELRGYKVNAETRADAVPAFQPEPVAINDYADLNSLIEFNWDAVQDIAVDQGWTWDTDQGVYVAGGEPVEYERILELIQEQLQRLESEIDEATQLLTNGEATVAEWEELVAETVVATALLFFLLGLGRRPTANEEARLSRELERQFKYLRQFSRDILTGVMTPAGIAARGKLYIHDAELAYVLAQELAHPKAEFPYVKNTLGDCQHCLQCPMETDRGWVRRGEMSIPGTRQCKFRCCCSLEYAREGDIRLDKVKTILDVGAGWL